MNRTRRYGNRPLELAAIGLIVGAAIHVVAWAGGPPWMAALGALPSIVASAAAGTWPALVGTLVIAAMLTGLACCCVMTSRGNGARYLPRAVLAAAAVLFTARGLLVVPYALAGQRAWRTPIGRFVVTGQYFTAGSIVVLAIGMLIGIGLFQSRSKRHGIPTQVQPEVG